MKSYKFVIPFTLLAVMFTISSCTAPEKESPEQKDPFLDTEWQLVEFQSMSDEQGVTRPDDPALYTMKLHADSTVSMKLNCNRATGTWKVAPSEAGNTGSFEFGPLGVTRALCPPPSMDEMIARQFQWIRSFMIRNDTLYLSMMADGGIWVWELLKEKTVSVVPLNPEQGGALNFILSDGVSEVTMYAQRSTSSEVVATYQPGVLLDNLGCGEYEGSVWCYVQRMAEGPSPVGYIQHEFLASAVGPNGGLALGPDDSSLRIGQGEYDASGTIPCKLSSGQPTTNCEFIVARSGEGYATVKVTISETKERIFFFRLGIPIGLSVAEADPTGPFSKEKESDLNIIHVGDERYEIPDAVVLDG